MNKIFFKTMIATAVFTFSLLSCATKNQTKVSSDVYNDSRDDSKTQTEISDKTPVTKTDKKQTNLNKKNNEKSFIEDLFTFGNKGKYIYGPESSINALGALGGIVQKKSIFTISVKNNDAGFGSQYMAAYYIILMNYDARKKFINAYENYLKDFENKKLNRKDSKTFKAYGNINFHADWGTISSSTPNHGDTKGYLGYEFVKGSPYFLLSSYPFHNDHYDLIGEATSKESLRLKYYFTKAQAKALVDFLAEDNIKQYIDQENSYLLNAESDDYYSESSTQE